MTRVQLCHVAKLVLYVFLPFNSLCINVLILGNFSPIQDGRVLHQTNITTNYTIYCLQQQYYALPLGQVQQSMWLQYPDTQIIIYHDVQILG